MLMSAVLLAWMNAGCRRPVAEKSLGDGAEYLETEVAGVRVKMVKFDEMLCWMRVWANEERDKALSLAERGKAERAIVVCNGGYFDPGKFMPAGLEIADGKSTGVMVTGNSYECTLAVTKSWAHILWDGEKLKREKAEQLLQCNPWLLRDGKTFPPSKPDPAEPQARRTFIMTNEQGTWVLGVTSPVTLSGLSQLLAKEGLVPGFKPVRAMNLDGGPSTGLWVRGREDELANDQPKTKVRNGIMLVRRLLVY